MQVNLQAEETGYSRFIARLKGIISAYYELCSVTSGWLTSVSVVVISITLFIPGVNEKLPWLAGSCQIIINIALDAAFFGCQALVKRATQEGNEERAAGLSWAARGFFLLMIVTLLFSYLDMQGIHITGVPLVVLMMIRWAAAIAFAGATHEHGAGVNIAELRATITQQLTTIEELRATIDQANNAARQHTIELEARDRKAKEMEDINGGLLLQIEELTQRASQDAIELKAKGLEIGGLLFQIEELRAEAREVEELRRKVNELKGLRQREEELEAKAKELKETRKLKAIELKGLEAKAEEATLAANELMIRAAKANEPAAANESGAKAKIRTAMLQFVADGKELKYNDIAASAGVGYSTVKLHFKEIAKEIQEPTTDGRLAAIPKV